MNTILKFRIFFLLFVLLLAGCQKDKIFELQIGDENAVITHEVNGVEFKFCLLNEHGQPATIFKEGENFYFQFSFKNNSDTIIYNDTSLFNNTGFCEVKKKNASFGSPYVKPIIIETIGLVAFTIPIGQTYLIKIPWVPDDENWNSGFLFFNKANYNHLPTGEYFTKFSHKFDFDTIETDKLTFKIYFKIQ